MMKLRYTKQAKEKYRGLTGSQRSFVDQGLYQLKQSDHVIRKLENKDLGLTIVCEQHADMVLIKDILYEAYRKSDNYRDAQKRMIGIIERAAVGCSFYLLKHA